jgi:purine-binding chemotaxis protein CheW
MSENQLDDRYILFRLNNELYGTPLLAAREVVEMQSIKKIPHTSPDFLGVINVRGEIIGVLDLRIRFNMHVGETSNPAMIVFATNVGTMAVVVDKLEAVARIEDTQIDTNPSLQSKMPLDYLLGIAKHGDQMVTLLDLLKTVKEEQFSLNNKNLAV